MKAKEELLYLKYILRSVEADAPSFIDSRRLPIAGWFLAAGYFLALCSAAVAHLDFRGRTSCKRRGRHCRRVGVLEGLCFEVALCHALHRFLENRTACARA